jgi:hypothetical protein
MVYQHGSGLLGNHQHLLQKACFSLLGLSQLCNQDASLFGLSFLTFGEELVLLEMLCQSLQMLLRGHQLGCIMPELRSIFEHVTFSNVLCSKQTLYSDQIASETQGLLGQKTQQLLNLWKVLCKIF